MHNDAKMLYVGKQSGFHTRTQDEIEAMLLGFAANGHTVVRLKGRAAQVVSAGLTAFASRSFTSFTSFTSVTSFTSFRISKLRYD